MVTSTVPATIFTAADGRYIPGALIALCSALSHSTAKRFVLVTSEPESPFLSNEIFAQFEQSGAELRIVDSGSLPLDGIKGATTRFPKEAFARFFPDHLVGEASGMALYIDSDAFIMGGLDGLLSTELGGRSIAIAPDLHLHAKGKAQRQLSSIGCSAAEIYLCSGVLLLDIERYVESGLRESITSILAKRGGTFTYPDQDAMNLADRRHYAVLDPIFNFPPSVWRLLSHTERKKVAIVHFYGSVKPWDFEAYRIPADLLAAYDDAARRAGLLEQVTSRRADQFEAKRLLFASKFWLENAPRIGMARRALAQLQKP